MTTELSWVKAMTTELKFGDGTKQIPTTPYYVLSNDNFMSGWGHARNMINTIILPCRSYDEALAVERYCRERPEQKRVRIVVRKPTLRRGVLYSVVNWDNYAMWYQYSPEIKPEPQAASVCERK